MDVSTVTGSNIKPERARLLKRAIESTDIAVFYQDADLKYVWIENPLEGWSDRIIGATDFDILPVEAARLSTEQKTQAISARSKRTFTLPVATQDGTRWFEIWADPDIDQNGKVVGILCSSVETTAQKHRELNLQNLLLEISHRSKNLLAIVQGLATSTMRHSDSRESFLTRFTQRVRSLSLSLEQFTQSEWEGASFRTLVNNQVIPFFPSNTQFTVNGDNPMLQANATLHLGLALQELASNSSQHSTWDVAKSECPKVMVNCYRHNQGQDNEHILSTGWCVVWEEMLREPTIDRKTNSLGNKTLLEIVPRAINGKAELDVHEDSLTYKLWLPDENIVHRVESNNR